MKVVNISPDNADWYPCFLVRLGRTCILLDCPLNLNSLSNYAACGSPAWIERVVNFYTERRAKAEENRENGDTTDESQKDNSYIPPEFDLNQLRPESPKVGIPRFDKINMTSVDAVLITNYQTLLALPYLTERDDFDAVVYATEPTMQLGKLLMEELADLNTRNTRILKNLDKFKNDPSICQAVNSPCSWKNIYDRTQVATAMNSVHSVSYGETIDIYGQVKATCFAAGFSLGSANWTIKSDSETVMYIGNSSALQTHAKPFKHSELRASCDKVNVEGFAAPDLVLYYGHNITGLTPDHSMENLAKELERTITIKSGCCLLPMQSVGMMLDVIDHIFKYLDYKGLKFTPVYIVRPKARDILASSQIYAEWLHPSKAEKAYKPETPFAHDEYIQCNRLFTYEEGVSFERSADFGEHGDKYSMNRSGHEHPHKGLGNGFKKPCIIIACYPSCRIGEVAKILDLFSREEERSKNTVIFTEFDTDYLSAIKPFKPSCEVRHFPIDTRFEHASAVNLFTEFIQPTRILTNNFVRSKIQEKTLKNDQKSNDLLDKIKISKSGDTHVFKQDERATKYKKIRLGPNLSKRIKLAEICGNNHDWMCSFKGLVTKRDGSYSIDLPADGEMVRTEIQSDRAIKERIDGIGGNKFKTEERSRYDGKSISSMVSGTDKNSGVTLSKKQEKEKRKLEEKHKNDTNKRKFDDNFVRTVGLKAPKFDVLVESLQKSEIGDVTVDDFEYSGSRYNVVTVDGKISIKLLGAETAIEILDPTDQSVRALKKKVVAVLMNHISI